MLNLITTIIASALGDHIPFLADVAAEDVGQIILTILAGGGVGVGAYMTGRAKAVHVSPQPLEISPTKEYATRAELQQEATRLSNRIDIVTTSTASIDGKLDQIAITQQQILKALINTTRHE